MYCMTRGEKLLTRCLFISGMHWTEVMYIVGSLSEKGIDEMLEYIAIHQKFNKDDLYTLAMEILEKAKREENEESNVKSLIEGY